MGFESEERPPLIQGIGDEVLLTLVAFCTILGCTVHFLSRRGYFAGLRRNAPRPAPLPATAPSTASHPPSTSSAFGDGLRRRHSVMETVAEEEEEEVEASVEAEGGGSTEEGGGSREQQEEVQQPEGSLPITVKYLDDSRRQTFYLPTERVEQFKERNFQEEIRAGKWVRLVHQGRELKDHLLMNTFSLQQDTVLHCLVTEHRHRGPRAAGDVPGAAVEDDEEAMYEPGQLLVPLLILMVCATWVWALLDRSSFRPSSLVILVVISAVIVYALIEQNLFARAEEETQPS